MPPGRTAIRPAQLQRVPFTSLRTAHAATHGAFGQGPPVVTSAPYYLSASSSDHPGKACMVAGVGESPFLLSFFF